MNKNNLKTYLYTISICIIIFGVIKIFFAALPYLLLAGFATWIGFRVYNFIKTKKGDVSTRANYESTKTKDDENKDGFDTSKAIDVEFKEVD